LAVAINHVGYLPEAPKVAFIATGKEPGDIFAVIRAGSEDTVFTGRVEVGVQNDVATGMDIYELDFSGLDNHGSYFLWLPRLRLKSESFKIHVHAYQNALRRSLESFYFQRCGIKIGSDRLWHHEICHVNDAVFYSDPHTHRPATGGWHDAGDYGKFSVNTAVSLAFLLYLFESHPQLVPDAGLDIPEAGNGIPDMLDEARWALGWLLKMQRDDGGVFHKIQKKQWNGEYLPHEDEGKRYIFEVSSTATAGLAAVAALGARLFIEFDRTFAGTLQDAAERAWRFLESHPQMVPRGSFQNPPDVSGGEYGDHQDMDERLWAAAELYRLTGKQKYHDYFLGHYHSLLTSDTPPMSWKNVEHFAWASYLRTDSSLQQKEARSKLREGLIKYADELVQRTTRHGYNVVLEADEYYWGSNSVALGYAFTLVQAFEQSGEEEYRDAALDQLHYVLGRNPFNISFVTGVGHPSVQHPYHQFSMKLETDRPVPGMLVGGPNSHSRLNGVQLSAYPGMAYEDNPKNYMVNEVAINYTAPFVYLTGYFTQIPHEEMLYHQTKAAN
jgi:endoglucanase